jgi:hypothetical protein
MGQMDRWSDLKERQMDRLIGGWADGQRHCETQIKRERDPETDR